MIDAPGGPSSPFPPIRRFSKGSRRAGAPWLSCAVRATQERPMVWQAMSSIVVQVQVQRPENARGERKREWAVHGPSKKVTQCLRAEKYKA